KLKVIDEIIKEPIGGAHRNPEEIFNSVKLSILNNLRELQKIPVSKLVLERYQRLRKIGKFIE
ncbi:acetyl-CoA carboxylase carboxyl transferase subunit alpha, partial [bacterium]|nr:acetyl-CoA carboxylase carboxyl transferase subunit alpha [bacterium]